MKRKVVLLGLAIIGVLLILGGSSVAFFNYMRIGKTENTLRGGTVVFHYDEKTKKHACRIEKIYI